MQGKLKAARAELEQQLNADQLGKAAAVVKNVSDASVLLEDILAGDAAVFEAEVRGRLAAAVAAAMELMKQLEMEQWQYKPPAAFWALFDAAATEAAVLREHAHLLAAVWDALELKAQQVLQYADVC
jgi:hypothetical protein